MPTSNQTKIDDFLYRIKRTPDAVLQYDHERDNLIVWFW
jgi:hypothetical protein